MAARKQKFNFANKLDGELGKVDSRYQELVSDYNRARHLLDQSHTKVQDQAKLLNEFSSQLELLSNDLLRKKDELIQARHANQAIGSDNAALQEKLKDANAMANKLEAELDGKTAKLRRLADDFDQECERNNRLLKKCQDLERRSDNGDTTLADQLRESEAKRSEEVKELEGQLEIAATAIQSQTAELDELISELDAARKANTELTQKLEAGEKPPASDVGVAPQDGDLKAQAETGTSEELASANELNTALQQKLEEIEKDANATAESTQTQIHELNETIGAQAAELAALKATNASLQEELEQTGTQEAKPEEPCAPEAEHKGAVDQLQASLDELQGLNADLTLQIEGLKETNAGLQQNVEESEAKHAELSETNATLQQKVEESEAKHAELSETNATLQQKVEESETKQQSLETELGELQASHAALAQIAEETGGLGEKLSSAEAELSAEKQATVALQQQLNETDGLSTTVATLAAEVEALKQANAALRQAQGDAAEAATTVAGELQAQLESATAELASATAEVTKAKNAASAQAETAKTLLEEKSAALAAAGEEIAKLKLQVQQTASEVERLASELAAVTAQSEARAAMQEELAAALAKATEEAVTLSAECNIKTEAATALQSQLSEASAALEAQVSTTTVKDEEAASLRGELAAAVADAEAVRAELEGARGEVSAEVQGLVEMLRREREELTARCEELEAIARARTAEKEEEERKLAEAEAMMQSDMEEKASEIASLAEEKLQLLETQSALEADKSDLEIQQEVMQAELNALREDVTRLQHAANASALSSAIPSDLSAISDRATEEGPTGSPVKPAKAVEEQEEEVVGEDAEEFAEAVQKSAEAVEAVVEPEAEPDEQVQDQVEDKVKEQMEDKVEESVDVEEPNEDAADAGDAEEEEVKDVKAAAAVVEEEALQREEERPGAEEHASPVELNSSPIDSGASSDGEREVPPDAAIMPGRDSATGSTRSLLRAQAASAVVQEGARTTEAAAMRRGGGSTRKLQTRAVVEVKAEAVPIVQGEPVAVQGEPIVVGRAEADAREQDQPVDKIPALVEVESTVNTDEDASSPMVSVMAESTVGKETTGDDSWVEASGGSVCEEKPTSLIQKAVSFVAANLPLVVTMLVVLFVSGASLSALEGEVCDLSACKVKSVKALSKLLASTSRSDRKELDSCLNACQASVSLLDGVAIALRAVVSVGLWGMAATNAWSRLIVVALGSLGAVGYSKLLLRRTGRTLFSAVKHVHASASILMGGSTAVKQE